MARRHVPIPAAERPAAVAEMLVLEVLAEARTTTSVIRLAADLYGRGEDDRFMYGDPIGFTTWLLEGLDRDGYVIYRVGTRIPNAGGPYAFTGLPYDIRLTKKGWAAVGYPHMSIEVGRNPGDREVVRNDPTDYRNHNYWAEGGPCERHGWGECPFPDRRHS